MRTLVTITFSLCILLAAAEPVRAGDPAAVDRSFGSDGLVTTGFAGREALARAVLVQPDGAIVVGGALDPPETGNAGAGATALVRYRPDGELDPSFGSGGRVAMTFGRASGLNDIARQADGKIVAAVPLASDAGRFGIARFNPDGSLDTSFGSGGLVALEVSPGESGGSPVALDVQPDGKVIALSSEFTLIRLNADGSLDATFGAGGRSAKPFGPGFESQTGRDIELVDDGKFLAVGVQCGSDPCSLGLARYSQDGVLDTSFGTRGTTTAEVFSPEAGAMYPSGRFVVVGQSGCVEFTPPQLCPRDVAVGFEGDGRLDATFGTRGRLRLYEDFQELNSATSSGGNIIAVGGSDASFNREFLLTRFTPEGDLDHSFGACGVAGTEAGAARARAEDIHAAPDGKLVVVGHAVPRRGARTVFVVARYLGTGARDPRARPTLKLPPVLEALERQIRRSTFSFWVRSPEIARLQSDFLISKRWARQLGIPRRVATATRRLDRCVLTRVRPRLTAGGRRWIKNPIRNIVTLRVVTRVRNGAGQRRSTARLHVYG